MKGWNITACQEWTPAKQRNLETVWIEWDLWSYQNNAHARASKHSVLLARVLFTSMALHNLYMRVTDLYLNWINKQKKRNAMKSHTQFIATFRIAIYIIPVSIYLPSLSREERTASRFTVTQDILNGSNQVAFVFI